jgi:hypothetical protein
MAQHVILGTVSPCLASVIKSKTTKEMWDAVRSDATSKLKMHEADTKRRLQEMRCNKGTDVKEHLTNLVRLQDELEGMGVSISDDDFATTIISSLPPSYCILLSSVTHAAALLKAKIDPNDLMWIILEEAEQCLITEHASGQSGSALYSKGSKQEQKKRGNSASNIKCNNCGCTGHTKDDCFHKGGGKEGQVWWQKKKKDKGTRNANAAQSLSKPDDNKSYAFQCTSNHANTVKHEGSNPDDIDGIMDSGADKHFCLDKNQFENFKTTQPL